MTKSNVHANQALKELLRHDFQIVSGRPDTHSVPLAATGKFIARVQAHVPNGKTPLTRKFKDGSAILLRGNRHPDGQLVTVHLQTKGHLSPKNLRLIRRETGLQFLG